MLRERRGLPWGAARGLSLVPWQVDSKVTLGLGGVAVVLGAVTAAMGFFSYLGVPSSLVILQVVPFLVLAVGADNIFIFVLEYQVRGRGGVSPSRWGSPAPPGLLASSARACTSQVPVEIGGFRVIFIARVSPALALPRAVMPSMRVTVSSGACHGRTVQVDLGSPVGGH